AIDHPWRALAEGGQHSFFVPRATKRAARKNWIMSARPAGRVTIDEGACTALAKGTSLRPIGVTTIEGAFGRGDAISI
ncbi:PUA domain-containing protein, partial [Maritalea mediterranea]|nr:glutamate 5-kinase [Maritalea mediterranea]